ncbi:MAG: winged helix-turn-helix domain-containing protein [Anaerolineaceae bacterium]|nr:winged helix-turn-helix domain-containing protein [Anaerolineaceae bacterium]
MLSIIQNNPAISYRALAEQLAINQSAISKHLRLLKEKGVEHD